METDIIFGFRRLLAEQPHGVRYMFVGDGDSSVFPTLQQNVPVWGPDIQKVDPLLKSLLLRILHTKEKVA